MGVALAAMGVFAPTRKRTLVKIAPRALIAANMASLMTASIAGNSYQKNLMLSSLLFFRSTLQRTGYTHTNDQSEFYFSIKDFLSLFLIDISLIHLKL